jgi:serine/threonine protein kinase
MPPEQLITRWHDNTEGYDYKIDVWALGGIFYQMLTGLFVFLPTEKTSYD